jgi:hypothetical protein
MAAPPIDFGNPHWLNDLLLYLLSAWLAWHLGRANGTKGA